MKDSNFSPIITVVTATKNVESDIEGLYQSLKRQNNRQFEWVIADGLSEDSTTDLLRRFAIESPWIRFNSEGDHGIYDAINKGISAARGDYYVVAGADDRFDEDALEQYAEFVRATKADVILAKVRCSGKVRGGFYPSRGWIGHSKAFRTSHSIGMLFKKSLHDTFGLYSKRFPMLADGYFLKQLIKSEAVFYDANFIAGTFSDTGISTVSKLQTLAETWQIQMLTESDRFLQTCMFIGKVIYRYPAVLRELKSMTARTHKKRG